MDTTVQQEYNHATTEEPTRPKSKDPIPLAPPLTPEKREEPPIPNYLEHLNRLADEEIRRNHEFEEEGRVGVREFVPLYDAFGEWQIETDINPNVLIHSLLNDMRELATTKNPPTRRPADAFSIAAAEILRTQGKIPYRLSKILQSKLEQEARRQLFGQEPGKLQMYLKLSTSSVLLHFLRLNIKQIINV